jgi:sugar O-acyltransferase (sialic acid O-acetyltransferase NeuD family)
MQTDPSFSLDATDPTAREIVLYGASGHGLAMSAMLGGDSTFPVAIRTVAFIDDTPDKIGTSLAGIPIVSFEQWKRTLRHVCCLVTQGSPSVRKKLVAKVLDAGGVFGETYPSLNRPFPPKIGVGSIIGPYAHVGTAVEIGRHVQVMSLVSLGHDVIIGDFATVCPGCMVSGYVVIEEGAFVGAGSVLVNGKPGKPLVIGAGAYVSAGSVVTKSVPAGAKVAGNPARPLRELAAERRQSKSDNA